MSSADSGLVQRRGLLPRCSVEGAELNLKGRLFPGLREIFVLGVAASLVMKQSTDRRVCDELGDEICL